MADPAPDRLAGLAPPPPLAPVAPPIAAEVAPAPAVGEETPAAAEPVQPVSVPKPARKAAAKESAPANPRPIGTRIPGSLFAEVNAARDLAGETHEMWFTRQTRANLPAIREHYRIEDEDESFPVRRARARRKPDEVLAQYPLRLNLREATALQALLDEVQAPSMSDLVTTVVRLGLRREHGQDTAEE